MKRRILRRKKMNWLRRLTNSWRRSLLRLITLTPPFSTPLHLFSKRKSRGIFVILVIFLFNEFIFFTCSNFTNALVFDSSWNNFLGVDLCLYDCQFYIIYMLSVGLGFELCNYHFFLVSFYFSISF